MVVFYSLVRGNAAFVIFLLHPKAVEYILECMLLAVEMFNLTRCCFHRWYYNPILKGEHA